MIKEKKTKNKTTPICPNASKALWISFSPSSTESVKIRNIACHLNTFSFANVKQTVSVFPLKYIVRYYIGCWTVFPSMSGWHGYYYTSFHSKSWTQLPESRLPTVICHSSATFSFYLFHYSVSSCWTLSTSLCITPKVIHCVQSRQTNSYNMILRESS